ncbi:PREDICTED: protein ACCELERATED CELL DEATH 6-like [Nelumbo nucifera]|uniref:Protein ACCELERATED CELL DEATH 6-like n=2 Tax=Nelumbo nucifera TaxID=4432 RepID=A0A1U7YU92_NELNU|nr:PREDICTED: protein ACCELERATED CELL DEATH 6-like [Nelumbo nucifera]DAD39672.1 TPA_asm: hypothetical protein HUJ06_013995 [Nelumbo nucifera]
MSSLSKAMVREVLTYDNYDDWKILMKNYLVGKNLWGIVDETEREPPTDDPSYAAWREKNSKALHAIQISCGTDMFSHVKKLSSAREAWKCLANECMSAWGRSRKITETLSSQSQKMKEVLGDDGGESLSKYRILYNAAFYGDWKTAKRFIDKHPEALTAGIDNWSKTALHVAAFFGNTNFVVELVKILPPEKLAIQNLVGSTAFHLVTEGGTRKMAEAMLEKNPGLFHIRDFNGITPLLSAANFCRKDVLQYLYGCATDACLNSTIEDSAALLVHLIAADCYGMALDLLHRCPEVASTHVNGETALDFLARKPYAFKSRNRFGFWHRQIYSWVHVELPTHSHTDKKFYKDEEDSLEEEQVSINGSHQRSSTHLVLCYINQLLWIVLQRIVPSIKSVRKSKLMHLQARELVEHLFKNVLMAVKNDHKVEKLLGPPLIAATEFGIVEFLEMTLKYYPRLIEYPDANLRCILHVAVLNRQEMIFNHLKKTGRHLALRTFDRDIYLNNILHLAAKLAPPQQLNCVSGAALQLQRELQWFKVVEKLAPPKYREWKNSHGLKPQLLFSEEHKDLVANGEVWMKETATSCTVAAALIITIMFAAAFTVPGGIQSDTGNPIFVTSKSFMVFVISDAFALFSSSTSMLMFLSILTSRYAEDDFLKSLPQKLIIGLAMLFFSIAAMMTTFCSTIFIMLCSRLRLISIVLTSLAVVPVTLFAFLQFPLFIDMVFYTYGSGIFRY